MGVGHQDLDPAPKGWPEKLADAGAPLCIPIVLSVSAFSPLRESAGLWSALAIVIVGSLATIVLAEALLRPARRKRTSLDAERGLFECAHREKGSVRTGKWAPGYAKAEPGALLFQAKTGTNGPVAGPVKVYLEPRLVGRTAEASWWVFPGGNAVTLGTNRGGVELLASPASLDLLTERTLNG